MAQRISSASQQNGALSIGRTHFGLRDLLTRARAGLRRSSLDAALASGADPCDSPALAHRAVRLTRVRTRERLAARVDYVLAAAQRPVRGLSSAIEPDRGGVAVASPRLIAVRELLRSTAPVYAQGVAMLEHLLRDGGSPLYVPASRRALDHELDLILAALGGDREPSDLG